jgi:Zn-dependent protease
VAHGYAANRLGDPTASSLGRLTLNPLKHLDPIGTLCMLIFRFGWAKPVPINSRYFQKPRRDLAIVALAGPLTNIVLAFVGMLLSRIVGVISVSFPPSQSFGSTALGLLLLFLSYFFQLNASFAIFNLLPIPPLDGSRLLTLFLPPKWAFKLMQYERFIALSMLLLLYLGILDTPLTFLVNGLLNGMDWLLSLLPFLNL